MSSRRSMFRLWLPLLLLTSSQPFSHAFVPNAFRRCFVSCQCLHKPSKLQDSSCHLADNMGGSHYSRATFFRKSLIFTTIATPLLNARPTQASPFLEDKQVHLSREELRSIIEKDLTQNFFLYTGNLTRSIYSEDATFTDEIDTYTLDKWIRGTQSLFDPSGSSLDLVDHEIEVTEQEVRCQFRETLMFRIPLLKPVVELSGTLVLTRDPNSGLITNYREFWDQDVLAVLKTAKFFAS